MKDKDIIEVIHFFDQVNISEEVVTTDEERKTGKMALVVTYKYKDKSYRTKKLYYQDITNLPNIKYKDRLIAHFGSPIFWLDIDFHKWPQNSDDSDLEGLVIPDICVPNDEDFKKFLVLLANNKQNGYIQKITSEGRTGQYYHNLENNNHWHDLVQLIKAVISCKGKKVPKKFFSRLVFKWDGNKNTIRERSTLSFEPYGAGRKLIAKLYENINKIQPKLNRMKNLKLLEYKRQIILQGPPGTGKTYTAKELAYQFITNSPLPTDGNERKKQLKELQDSGQFKIIQFHPAYTYEDFVRGITAKPNENGEGIIYEAENKTLGLFAKKALENYTNSKKTSDTLSKEIWIEKEFKNFVLNIVDRLEKEDIELTKKVDLVNIDPDAFRYKGKNGWPKNGNRMLFKDIKQAYLDDNKERQDIVQNKNLSSLANWHATYFLEVLKIFENYLKKNKSSFEINEENKVSLKNYVLIIDEINRANLPSVLGELIYALEYRDEEVDSMYEVGGSQKILLPSNLFIIGTMNTADRSVGHIDYAIRRRFSFVDVLPNKNVVHPLAQNLFKEVSQFFVKNYDSIDWSKPKPEKSKFLVGDFRPEDVWIGHSYFISTKEDDAKAKEELKLKLEYEIKPLLKEYVKDGILTEDAKNEIEKLDEQIN